MVKNNGVDLVLETCTEVAAFLSKFLYASFPKLIDRYPARFVVGDVYLYILQHLLALFAA